MVPLVLVVRIEPACEALSENAAPERETTRKKSVARGRE
jgi:hypothetical protein